MLFSLRHIDTQRRAIGMGFFLSAMVAIGGFHWIAYVAQNFGGMPLPIALGLLGLFCLVAGPQMVAFYFVGFRLRFGVERLPLSLRPLFWASLYTAFEYLARFPKIFPEHLGNTFLAFPYVAQSAAIGGVSLLSFLALFVGASLAYLRLAGSRAWPSALASVLLLSALSLWGRGELKRIPQLPSQTINVGIVQHNMEEVEKIAQTTSGINSAFDSILTRLLQRSKQLHDGPVKPDLLLWPETSYPIVFPTGSQYLGHNAMGYANLVKTNIAAMNTPLLFGGYENDGVKDYNAAFLLNGEGRIDATYRKNVLLVFGEYFPLDHWFPSLKKINPLMGDFGRGPGPEPLPFSFQGKSMPLGVNICYEAILPNFMRGYATGGARLLVNLTKDSWFGDTFEPWQHLQLSALRSIEHRLPMVRATNTGLSGLILPTGEIKLLSDPFEEAWATLAVPVPLEPIFTLYTAFGEWFAWATILLSLSLGAYAFRKNPASPIH